jgi:hypothetical protein
LDWTSDAMLKAVEQWATPDYWMMRETMAGAPAGRRLDGLLIPISIQAAAMRSRGFRSGYWTERATLIGIEIKSSRSDFLRGINEGQFSRYADTGLSMYVCTDRTVKTAEIPDGFGHLIYHRPPGDMHGWGRRRTYTEARVVCRRHPRFGACPMDADTMWRIVMHCADQVRDFKALQRSRDRELFDKLGDKVASALRAISQPEGG